MLSGSCTAIVVPGLFKVCNFSIIHGTVCCAASEQNPGGAINVLYDSTPAPPTSSRGYLQTGCSRADLSAGWPPGDLCNRVCGHALAPRSLRWTNPLPATQEGDFAYYSGREQDLFVSF